MKSRRNWSGHFVSNGYGIPYVIRVPVDSVFTETFPDVAVGLAEYTLDCKHVEGRYVKKDAATPSYVRCRQCQPAAEVIRKRLVDRLRA